MVKNLFIGQMVKVKYVIDKTKASLVGATGFIEEKSEELDGFFVWGLNCSPLEHKVEDGELVTYGFSSDQLEPILPEGAQPSEFSFTELMDNLGVVVA